MGRTKEYLQKLFEREQVEEIEFRGKCHDCGSDVTIVTHLAEDGTLSVTGGALWYTSQVFAKCEACFAALPMLTAYQPCEVYSRVVGYMRPIAQWNLGKKEEWISRIPFSLE